MVCPQPRAPVAAAIKVFPESSPAGRDRSIARPAAAVSELTGTARWIELHSQQEMRRSRRFSLAGASVRLLAPGPNGLERYWEYISASSLRVPTALQSLAPAAARPIRPSLWSVP